jgi:hypothetical protein
MSEHPRETTWRTALWQQFGAAIDMLENALVACPETRLPGASLDRLSWAGIWDLLGYHLPHPLLARPVSHRPLSRSIHSPCALQEAV